MSYTLADDVECRFRTNGEYNHFFGYYDKSPFDASGTRMLCHRVDFDGRPVEPEDTATVGYWDTSSGEFVPLGETSAFNWQQGSMLQWLPPSFEEAVVYNDRRDGSFVSVVVDVASGDERVLPRPVYAVHPSGEYALSANFERLYYCRRSYGYRGVQNPKWDQPMHEDDGIFRVDLETGAEEQLLSTPELCGIDPKPAFERDHNWLEHMTWNPSGTRFAFFHRWSDGRGAHETRLYTAAADGTDLHRFPDTGFYSHMDWRSDDWLTIWTKVPSLSQQAIDGARERPLLKKLLKPPYRFLVDNLYDSEDGDGNPLTGFVEFEDTTDRFRTLAEGIIREDGHNSWTSDERWMLTDTYADAGGTRQLRIWDDQRERLHELGSFDAPYESTGYRCDLHPRWDRSETRVVVDAVQQGGRQMFVLEPELDQLGGA